MRHFDGYRNPESFLIYEYLNTGAELTAAETGGLRSLSATRPLEGLQVCGRDLETSIYLVSISLYTSWNGHRGACTRDVRCNF